MAYIKRLLRWLNDLPGLCLRCAAFNLGLHMIPTHYRRHIHFGILAIIASDVIWAGVRLTDFGFLVLALLWEGETIKSDHVPPPPLDPSPYQIDHDAIGVQPSPDNLTPDGQPIGKGGYF